MTLDQAIAHYKSQRKLAMALAVNESCVSNWRKRNGIPAIQQLRIQRLTSSKLKADAGILEK